MARLPKRAKRRKHRMIVPTAEYDPTFAEDGVPFREKMTACIRREFADLLGPHAGLPATDAGLERLSRMVHRMAGRPGAASEAA